MLTPQIDRAYGHPPARQRGTREEESLQRELANAAQEIAKPPRRIRLAESGSFRIPAEVFDGLDRPDPAYWIQDLGVLVFFSLQLEAGRALTPGGRVEGVGDAAALVVDLNLGIGAVFDQDGRLTSWRKDLDHLAEIGWFVVVRQGRFLRISRGERFFRSLKKAA